MTQASIMLLLSSSSCVVLEVLEPPWVMYPENHSGTRRTLGTRVKVLSILAPYRARESIAETRRNLVIPLESSGPRYKTVLMFIRSRVRWTPSLFAPSVPRNSRHVGILLPAVQFHLSPKTRGALGFFSPCSGSI